MSSAASQMSQVTTCDKTNAHCRGAAFTNKQRRPFILTRLFFPVYYLVKISGCCCCCFSQCTGVNLAYGLPTTFSSILTCPKHLPYKVPSFSYLLSTLLFISSWAYLSFHHHLPAVSQFSLSNTTHLSSQHGQTTSTCSFD